MRGVAVDAPDAADCPKRMTAEEVSLVEQSKKMFGGRMDAANAPVKQPWNDPVNHPLHYTSLPVKCSCGKPVECIQVTEQMGFNTGNAVKYLWRAGKKDDRLQDLKKAAWYINREVERMKKEERGN